MDVTKAFIDRFGILGKTLFLTWIVSFPVYLQAAVSDSIYVSNGNLIIVGEIKGMDRGVLTIETDYSDSDFKIEWEKITEIYSKRLFIINTKKGNRYYGTIRTDKENKDKVVIIKGSTRYTENLSEVVFIEQVDKNFLSRLSASIDIGFSYAKTNNLTQFSARSNLGYLTDAWSIDASYNSIISSQDSIDPTRRNEGDLTYNYFLPFDWFVPISYNFLQNNEQKLKLRSITKAGIGNYIVRSNSIYFAAAVGAAWNNENYTDSSIPSKNSTEGFIGLGVNIFNLGDLELLSNLLVYPSFTESGRVRADFKFDLKYDLPADLYIKPGFTLNYDNKPAEGASESDYIIQINLGWEL